ncbi:hypothetical protein HPB47_015556 [Ixodes persulcatus]|uniref:Uncharacterized protein n=1 Tax=Ixodes persulcatus TaxID=34615 RepID=A0AC60QT58_IXOPE|nr:hypothetical protein HPB47_015556 [Ixodes persulcatus]
MRTMTSISWLSPCPRQQRNTMGGTLGHCTGRLMDAVLSIEVSKLDYLCYNCSTHFTKQITLRSSELGVDSFMPPEEAMEDLKRSVCLTMRLAYDENVASGSSEQKSSTCTEWADNIRRAFAATASPREGCQLLTLLPSTLTRNEVQKIIPEASIYIINRSWKLREDHGVWYLETALETAGEVDSVKSCPSEADDSNSDRLSNVGNKPPLSTVYADAAIFSDTSVEAKRVFENNQVGREVAHSLHPVAKATFSVNPYLIKSSQARGDFEEDNEEDI